MEEMFMKNIPLIRSIFQGTILGFTLTSAYFLSKGTKNLSAEDILNLSRPFYGLNLSIVSNLSKQRAQTTIGFQSLLIALLLQITLLFLPVTLSALGNIDSKGIIAGFVLAALSFLWFRKRCDDLESDIKSKIQEIQKKEVIRT